MEQVSQGESRRDGIDGLLDVAPEGFEGAVGFVNALFEDTRVPRAVAFGEESTTEEVHEWFEGDILGVIVDGVATELAAGAADIAAFAKNRQDFGDMGIGHPF